MNARNYFIQGAIDPVFIGEQIAKHSSKHDIGAHSIFLGQVRADEKVGKHVAGIEYSAYEDMANQAFSKIREEAFEQWPLNCLHIYHSTGLVKTGELSLFVFCSSGHRKESIKAMKQIVEGIKHKVPIWKKEIMVLDDEGNELLLPKNEMIPADFYKKGETVKAIVHEVNMINGSPKIILSRTSPVFLEKLMELEVPEILDGLITIKKIVREPGERAKIAVESYDDRIDPVGACVGMKGSRIHGIVRELRNENIDVINFTTNTSLFIQRALNPAKISSISIDDNTKKANVFLSPDQVSLAIGKGGFNIRLASKLVGYDIEVYREDVEFDDSDIDLEEFADEIDSWIIDELKAIGCDTAKSVLEIGVVDLVSRTDLEKETIEEVFRILQAEFE